MTLFETFSQIKSSNPYFSKDLAKTKHANKFIGRGSLASSTHKYMIAAGPFANCGTYTKEDTIFVSAEGMRKNRIDIDRDELLKAIIAGATFITDDLPNRLRPYNQGERQVAYFLTQHGYSDNNTGIWKKT